jgi:hypothetical protein
MISAAMLRQPSLYERAGFVLVACVLHLLGAVVILNIKMPQGNSVASAPDSTRVRVRVSAQPNFSPIAPAVPTAKIAASHKLVSPTAPRIPKTMLLPDVKPLTPDVTPEPEPLQMPQPLERISQFSPNLASLLPQSNKAYMEAQRDKGELLGNDTAANEELLPVPETPSQGKVFKPKIVTTEFSTLAYRIDLERRFADAWGGVRILPSFTRFVGKVGELIVYNVVVNRDGSLRRIVNVSAIEQAGRDFSPVDNLVQDFADSVFPINPIPNRIREEPFVVKWAIRYMGAQYSFF